MTQPPKERKSKFGMPHIISPALKAMREQARAAWRVPAKINGEPNTDGIAVPNPEQDAIEAFCRAIENEDMWLGQDEFGGEPRLICPKMQEDKPAYNAANLRVAISAAGQHQITRRAIMRDEGKKAMEEIAAANAFNPMRDRYRRFAKEWDGQSRIGALVDECFGGFADIPPRAGNFLLVGVAFQVGCAGLDTLPYGVKADEMIVLRGRQGRGNRAFQGVGWAGIRDRHGHFARADEKRPH